MEELQIEDDLQDLLKRADPGKERYSSLNSSLQESEPVQSIDDLKKSIVKEKENAMKVLADQEKAKKKHQAAKLKAMTDTSAKKRKSDKISEDPILELEHIIGYNGSTCKDLHWSKEKHE